MNTRCEASSAHGHAPRRYQVNDLAHGFIVARRPHSIEAEDVPDWMVDLAYEYSGGRRRPVEVRCTPCSLEVLRDGEPNAINLVDFYTLLKHIAYELMADWVSGERSCEHEYCDCRPRDYVTVMDTWVRERTAACINGLVHPAWRRLLSTVDPIVLQAHKNVFSATFGFGNVDLITRPEFYDNRYLVHDVARYRAAAVAVLVCDRRYSLQDGLETLTDWKSMFSPSGESYTALNRTLMNLPGNISPRVLLRLRNFILPRAITNRLELIATILAHSSENGRHLKVWSFASAGQIKEAMRRISAFRHCKLSSRRWREVQELVQFIGDYPDRHNGNIVGLARKAIRWHREIAEGRIRADTGNYQADTELVKPPVPLPELPGIRFLATVGDVLAEGEHMQHCIGAYIHKAMNEAAYLFHVEYEGEHASVEVDWMGQVVQAHGPRNQLNSAVEWGRRALQRWGRGIAARNKTAR